MGVKYRNWALRHCYSLNFIKTEITLPQFKLWDMNNVCSGLKEKLIKLMQDSLNYFHIFMTIILVPNVSAFHSLRAL